MRIFKFGGASVKDVKSVKNLLRVLQHEGTDDTLLVISAMGKMTNAFENVVHAYLYKPEELQSELSYIASYHLSIVDELFEKSSSIFKELEILLLQLKAFLSNNTSVNYNYTYDQIVPFGELLSTKIVSFYLQENQVENQWLDIRTIIKTNSNYRNAKVDWPATQENCKQLNAQQLYVTQGFISNDNNHSTTTLGREGSDFTAGILAFCLNAKSVTIWKDVDGVLNADPKIFHDTKLLKEISYQEAIEMSFYGASVIHPKTLKPLENKRIPLFVRSFDKLGNQGTKVSKGIDINPKTPCFILKKNQILVSISTNDFSFMVEDNLSEIFKLLHECNLKVNLIQNSAISFSVCLEDNFNQFNEFHLQLKPKYTVKYNTNVSLFTVRHFDEDSKTAIENKGEVLLKQISRETIQFVIMANKN